MDDLDTAAAIAAVSTKMKIPGHGHLASITFEEPIKSTIPGAGDDRYTSRAITDEFTPRTSMITKRMFFELRATRRKVMDALDAPVETKDEQCRRYAAECGMDIPNTYEGKYLYVSAVNVVNLGRRLGGQPERMVIDGKTINHVVDFNLHSTDKVDKHTFSDLHTNPRIAPF